LHVVFAKVKLQFVQVYLVPPPNVLKKVILVWPLVHFCVT
jgi:hypothetical protein